MTHIALLRSTNPDLVAYVTEAARRGETAPGRDVRTAPGGTTDGQAS
ncbi:hypothetical protein ACWGDT_23645 [Streptomyces avermitilis]